MKLIIHTQPPMVFEPPALESMSGWQWAGGGVSPVITARLAANERTASQLNPPPLRAAASLEVDAHIFNGVVQSVTLGSSPEIKVET